MAGYAYELRDQIRSEILRIIISVPSIRIIASIASVKAVFEMASINDADSVYALTYKTVTERFQYFLQDLSKQTGGSESGMVVSDHRSASNDRALRAHHQRLIGPQRVFTSKIHQFRGKPLHAIRTEHRDSTSRYGRRINFGENYEKNDERCYAAIERELSAKARRAR